jgi:ABC-type polysaccharide/polyol phosphate transport system ATPase subunit
MTEIDVRLEGVWKDYRLGRGGRAETFSALKDLNLQIPRGTSFGVIGRNGAGKSTLLKLLAGITSPSRGRITLAGRVSALIEVGSGFHPELTGRENTFLSGAILGMRRHEIADKLTRIVDFAGVHKFIDTPVKWYSSGMYVRLGFAIAAHLEPDILLVDEVLAVGDAEFQAKCLGRIQEMKRRGVTIVFISHDLTAVERLCDQAVCLEAGTIVSEGSPSEVVAHYHRRLAGASAIDPLSDGRAAENRTLTLTNISLTDPQQQQNVAFRTGGALVVRIRFTAARRATDVSFEAAIYSSDGKTLFATLQTSASGPPITVDAPGGVLEFTCAALPLQPGAYYVAAIARDATTSHVIGWFDGNTTLYVTAGFSQSPGLMSVPHTWRLLQTDADERPIISTSRHG